MNAPTKPMTGEDFIDWCQKQPRGRFELVEGEIVGMAAERALHRQVKHRLAIALEHAISVAGVPCHFEPDGATVRISEHTAFEPDALVYCGAELPDDSVIVPEPIIVCEVLSPSTAQADVGRKLTGYFKVPSLQHYLIIDPESRGVIHHQRLADGSIRTLMLSDGALTLTPPGLAVPLTAIFPAARKT